MPCSTVELLATASPDRDAAIEAALRNCLTESNLSIGPKTVVRTTERITPLHTSFLCRRARCRFSL